MPTPAHKKRPKSAQSTSSHKSKPKIKLSLITTKASMTPSHKTPRQITISPTKSCSFPVTEKSSKSKHTPKHISHYEKTIDNMFPTHLDVIDRIRKIKNLSKPMPFSPEFPPQKMPFSSIKESLASKIKARKDYVKCLLPTEPEYMDVFLKRLKETERIIRQENEFVQKVRRLKPKIQLVLAERGKVNETPRRIRRKNNAEIPVRALRTGIIAQFNTFS